MDGGKADDAGVNIRALMFALLALACGHMLSTLLRTIPAISLDLMAADFDTPPQSLASLTSIYHFAFAASQIPVGAAMDRFGVRPVSLSLLIGTIAGASLSGFSIGPKSFLFGQFLLGVATSGMLMCPMTLAAKQLSPARFGLWSGLILSIGNIGMLLSSSPLAFVVEHWGWRAGFWISAGLGVVVALPSMPWCRTRRPRMPIGRRRCRRWPACSRIGLSHPLRGLIAISLVSLAAVAGAAGIVGRPMADGDQGDEPDRSRQRARPVHDRADRRARSDRHFRPKFGHRREVLAATHCLAALLLVADGGGRAAFSGLGSVRRCGHAGAI